MLDRSRQARNADNGEIYLPMARSDIADYVGFSRRPISFRDRRHLWIADHDGLASLIAQQKAE
jgi:hypothetical protein